VSVPSVLNRTGDFSDSASSLTGKVNGGFPGPNSFQPPGMCVTNASRSTQRAALRTPTVCFPNAIIPQQAFGLPATKMLQFIPSPQCWE